MTSVLEQQTNIEQVVSSKLTTIEGLAEQGSQRLLTLNQAAEGSATCTSEAVVLNQQILCQLAEDVRHVKYQLTNSPPRGALDPTRELPVILEDALGFQLTVPMDWIDTWDVSLFSLKYSKSSHSLYARVPSDLFSPRASTNSFSYGSKNSERAKSWSRPDYSPSKIMLLAWMLTEASQYP